MASPCDDDYEHLYPAPHVDEDENNNDDFSPPVSDESCHGDWGFGSPSSRSTREPLQFPEEFCDVKLHAAGSQRETLHGYVILLKRSSLLGTSVQRTLGWGSSHRRSGKGRV